MNTANRWFTIIYKNHSILNISFCMIQAENEYLAKKKFIDQVDRTRKNTRANELRTHNIEIVQVFQGKNRAMEERILREQRQLLSK